MSESVVVSKRHMTLRRSASSGSTGLEHAHWQEEPGSDAVAAPLSLASSRLRLGLPCAFAREPRARAPTAAKALLASEGKGRRPLGSGSGAMRSGTGGRGPHPTGSVWRNWGWTRSNSSSGRCPGASSTSYNASLLDLSSSSSFQSMESLLLSSPGQTWPWLRADLGGSGGDEGSGTDEWTEIGRAHV